MTQTEAPKHEPEEVERTVVHDDADDHHDPLHDIDGLKTTLGVFGTVFLIVGLIWVMTHMFNLLSEVEREKKIRKIPPRELADIRKVEDRELAGKNPKRGTMALDAAIEKYIKSK